MFESLIKLQIAFCIQCGKQPRPWVEQPPQVDVAWFGLPLHPHHGEQEIYSDPEERNLVSSTLDRVFAWACAHGADAIVMPPFAVNMGGFLHPRLHFAGLIHEVSKLHERHLPVVCVASEHPAHCQAAWWDDFAKGVIDGRPVPQPIIHVPRIPLMSDKLVGKDGRARVGGQEGCISEWLLDAAALLEKRRKQQGVWSTRSRQVAEITCARMRVLKSSGWAYRFSNLPCLSRDGGSKICKCLVSHFSAIDSGMADLLRRLPQPRQTLEVADASVGSFKAAAATETAIVAASRGPPPYGKRKEHCKTRCGRDGRSKGCGSESQRKRSLRREGFCDSHQALHRGHDLFHFDFDVNVLAFVDDVKTVQQR
eukprot:s298_g28.t1